MKLLLLLFLLPMAMSQRYWDPSAVQDEPFLPIFPVYPYSPKLMKRGVEKDLTNPLNAELFPPKQDARDSYSTSYQKPPPNRQANANYSPTYIPLNQDYGQTVNQNQYTYPTTPYTFFNGYQTALFPQQVAAMLLPNYQQLFYPNYQQYSTIPQQGLPSEPYDVQSEAKSKLKADDAKNDGYADNYLTPRDQDGQSTTYRLQPQVNQVEASEVYQRSAQLPASVYRLISAAQGGQQTYVIPPSAAYQSYDQPTDLAKFPEAAGQAQYDQSQRPVIAKTGLGYVMNPAPFQVSPRHVGKEVRQAKSLKALVSLEPSQAVYIPPQKVGKAEYVNYGLQSQVYDDCKYPKGEESVVYATPQAYTYQFSGYGGQNGKSYKTTLDDVNFGAKRSMKRLAVK